MTKSEVTKLVSLSNEYRKFTAQHEEYEEKRQQAYKDAETYKQLAFEAQVKAMEALDELTSIIKQKEYTPATRIEGCAEVRFSDPRTGGYAKTVAEAARGKVISDRD